MSKYKLIEGNCPYCNSTNSVRFCDLHYGNNKVPYATGVPVCSKCNVNEIEVRKINNRRFKIVGRY